MTHGVNEICSCDRETKESFSVENIKNISWIRVFTVVRKFRTENLIFGHVKHTGNNVFDKLRAK